jgi:hypothetical protein
MNNHEAVVAVLRRHREARAWTDEAAATEVLAQLGLDAGGEAKDATPAGDPSAVSEDEVTAHEQAAANAVQKAKEAREQLNQQQQAEGAEPTTASRPPSRDPLDLAPGTMEPNLPPVPAPASALEAPAVDGADAAQEKSVVDKGATQDAGKPSTRASFSTGADDDKDSKDSKRK